MAYCVYCGAGEAERFCTNCGKEQPKAAARFKKPKISKKALIITTAVLLALGVGTQQALVRFVLPYSGPLEVFISNTSGSNEISSVIYQVVVDQERATIPTFGRTAGFETEWESEQPVQIKVISKLRGEDNINLELDPRAIGTFGLNPGSAIKVEIAFRDGAVSAVAKTGDSLDSKTWTTVSQGTMQRTNFTANVRRCVENSEDASVAPVAFAEAAYPFYEDSLERARLDGNRELYYREWEERTIRLAGFLQSKIDEAPEFEAEVGEELWRVFIRSFRELRDSWEYLADVSDREAENEWDPAWDRIRAAETKFDSAARIYALAGSNTYESCLDTLYK